MNEIYVLILYICMPGAWNYCSSGLLESRIENIPSKTQCEQVLKNMRKDRKLSIKSGTCVPQINKGK